MNLYISTRPWSTLAFIFFVFGLAFETSAQSGTEFWLAPPDITDLHNAPGGEPLYLLVSSAGGSSTVTIEQPANGAFTPIVVNVIANKSVRVNLTPFKSQLETGPTNAVLNTGLHITSTSSITCYYECANTNNTDIWALKGPNAEGVEFYIPLHKHAPFFNEPSFGIPHQAIASFDICATEDNTVVSIYSPTPVDGHPALQQFSVNLNRGQTYSCGYSGANWTLPSNHPSGAIVLANYPITVSLKDDSNRNPSGGCYDILGDQIVPTDVVGEDYIAVKGSLNSNGDESVVLMATQNNTQVFMDGSFFPVATLFAGEYFRIDMDYLSVGPNNSTYIHCTKPTYAMHITGFGCEAGMAQLPPLNCAGSQQLNFVRDDAQTFYLTVLCRQAAVDGFTVTGSGTATIPASAFVTVPGTDGAWMAAKINYNITQVPVDSTFNVSNSVDVFALGVGNGGATSGCKYGYFSEFVAPIVTDAGLNQTVCANSQATLNGAVSGGTITGEWTSSGTGTFIPSNTALDALYIPTAADAAVGSVVLTLTSTGACTPISDAMTLTITPPPTANAGQNQFVCSNNPNISISGNVTVATGGVWTGGTGTFIPGNNVLNPVYTPSASEISSGSLTLVLTTTGNGICNPVSDNTLITFTPSPIVNAGPNQTVCSNNANVSLSGSISVATGGVWTGGTGSYSPSATVLNPLYTPSAEEILIGSVSLTLTSTGNVTCNSVSDQITIFFTTSPTAYAGNDQIFCANNAVIPLSGIVTIASGGQWSGGLGIFLPNNNSLTSSYTPTLNEIASGGITMTLTTTGNVGCMPATDQVYIAFTPAPTANAGSNISTCSNNAQIILNGSFTTSSGATWSGGNGTFIPNNTSMNASYIPTPSEIGNGGLNINLTTTGNGTCSAVNDVVQITFTPSPIVNAGSDQSRCANNPNAQLNAAVSNATGANWSGGLGTFNPSTSSLNAIYTPTASEISNGSVALILTSIGNGNCNAVNDVIVISYSSIPTVNAGIDQTLCGNNAGAVLAGNVSTASGGQWTGGLGIFSPNANTLNANYSPTATEIAGGSVNLTLTSTGNGGCIAVSDNLIVTFTPAPQVAAGGSLFSCSNNSEVNLSGSYTISTGVFWTGGNGNFTPSNTSVNAFYTPTVNDIATGGLSLTLTTTGNGTCLPVSDVVNISIATAPLVSAGSDHITCINNLNVGLSGSISGISNSGIWSASGSGIFVPNNTTLNAIYQCSAQDVAAGSVIITLTSTNNGVCLSEMDETTITILPEGSSSAGSDVYLCSNDSSVELNGTVGGGASSGVWGSTGNGIFFPNNQSLNTAYNPSAFDIANGTVTLYLTANSCNAAIDSLEVIFTPAPVVSTGNDLTICSSVTSIELNGSVSGGTNTGIWTSSGTGIFSPSNSSLTASYTPSASDLQSQTVILTLTSSNNGQCLPESDSMILSILEEGLAFAGNDQTLCSNNALVNLIGTLSGGANQAIWSSSGSGIFIPTNTNLNTSYQPSSADILNGSATITLSSPNTCNITSDNILVNFTSAPIVDAGADLSSCANNSAVNLDGSFAISTGAIWSGGIGSYSPSNSTMNATYTPSASEIEAGFVSIVLTSNGNGNCLPVYDIVDISIVSSTLVNAGIDRQTCVNDLNIALNGSIQGITSSGEWTGSGTGIFSPSNTSLNVVYEMSAQDSIAGNVTLTLTSSNNQYCLPVSDQMTISIIPVSTASAGNDITLCSNNAIANLNGIVGGGASSGFWSTTGTGIFSPNIFTLNANYVPSDFDKANGGVNLLLTSSTCISSVDSLYLTLTPAPNVIAGTDQTICASEEFSQLSATIDGATTSGIWTSSGNGSFSPSNTDLNATYNPSGEDVQNQNISLILTSSNNGLCHPETDTLILNIYPLGTSIAGSDQSLCSNDSNASLNGELGGGATIGAWSTTGSGFFAPNSTTLDASYIPSEADLFSGGVILSLTATNSCNNAIDFLSISFTPSPIVEAGEAQTACGNNPSFTLNGNVTSALGGIWSGGNGTFTPNNTSLNAIYQPTALEVANGTVVLTLSSTGNDNCIAVSDNVILSMTNGIISNAGVNQEVCISASQTQLQGIISNGSATGAWVTLGSGTFSPNASALNAIYEFSLADLASENITLVLSSTNNGTCPVARDTINISFGQSAFAYAGNDQNICATDTQIQLNGLVTGGASTGIWQSNGNGSFTPDFTNLSASYTLSSSDISNGEVYLILTSTDNGTCLSGVDTLVYTINAPSVVNVGGDLFTCANELSIPIAGSVGGASTTGVWSSLGSGTFSPDNTSLLTSYLASPSDSLLGSLSIVLSSTETGSCPIDKDTLVISIHQPPTAFAGINQNICSSTEEITLYGNIGGGATSSYWIVAGSGGFSTSPDSLIVTYNINETNISEGTVNFILTAEADAGCPSASDTVVYTITPATIVNAGNNFTICSTNLTVPLAGIITGTTTEGLWSAMGNGIFLPDNSNLNSTYIPSINDSIVGSVNLILTSIDSEICPNTSDTLEVLIIDPSIANAGSDQTICSTEGAVDLAGLVSGGSNAGLWSSSGSGIFTPDNSTLSGTYIPSQSDIVNGSVTISLLSQGDPSCLASIDQMQINLIQPPLVNAGPDKVVCGEFTEVNLSGLISGATTTGIWISNGSGDFVFAVDSLNNVYDMSTADVNQGIVTLLLSSTNNTVCAAVTDTLLITVEALPVASFSSTSGEDLGVQFYDESTGSATWNWNFGEGGTSTMQNPMIVFPEEGSYSVTLVITSQGGCIDSTTTMIQAIEIIGTPVAIPSGFSPNGDGSNEVLHVLGGPFKEIDFRIYNGWGNEIFYTTDVNGGWDGTYKGKDQPGGVYVYTATGITLKDRFVRLSGNVTLIR